MAKTDPLLDKDVNVHVIAGDPAACLSEFRKFGEKNEIIERSCSSQIIQIQNPNYVPGVSLQGTPSTMQTVLQSMVIYYKKKEA